MHKSREKGDKRRYKKGKGNERGEKGREEHKGKETKDDTRRGEDR